MHHPIGLLTDNINWVQPLARAMEAAGVAHRLIPFPPPLSAGVHGRDYPDVIFNRVAIRTAMGAPGLVTLVRDLLAALQLQGKRIINNGHCHQVGASKALQSLIFKRAGVLSPKTIMLHDKAVLAAAREQMPDGMLKPNVGGFGAGVWAPGSPVQDVPPSILAAAFAADGTAVWQQRRIPRDNVIYRVELLGGKVLYRARVPVQPDSFNHCLGKGGSLSCPGTAPEAVTLDLVPETELRAALADICKLAGMDVGSVEYLIPYEESAACFFDINPVSTYFPNAAALLGFDPYKKLAAWLKDYMNAPIVYTSNPDDEPFG
jgi:hypothetical protein